jgi:hypothetical protein
MNNITCGDGWLTILGSVLTFSGTVFLGFISLWQNKKANDLNKRLVDIEDSRYSSDVILYRDDIQIEGKALRQIPLSNENDSDNSSEDNSTYESASKLLFFRIKNHGEAVLKKIEIKFPRGEVFSSHIVLAKDEVKSVKVEIPKNLGAGEKIDITFISSNNRITHGSFKITEKDTEFGIKYYHFYGLVKK